MLIAAAADPEPVVRASAVRALAATGQTARVTPPLTARLIDQARVVRARAAEALLRIRHRATAEAPPAGAFRLRNSVRAARIARPLDGDGSATCRSHPYVVKGVLAARNGRYQEAVELWKKARALEPGYPRIDELIAEGEKRKAGAR